MPNKRYPIIISTDHVWNPHPMKRSRLTIKTPVLILLGLLLVAPFHKSLALEPSKRILLLYSFGYGLPAYEKVNPAFLSVMKNAGVSNDDLFFEYLDLLRNTDKEHRHDLLNLLLHKYAGNRIDLIVTVHGPALNFLLNEGKEICPNVPVVSLLAPENIETGGEGRQIVSMPIRLDMRGTLERALDLFPETRRVVYVGGFSAIDRRFEGEARSAFAPWQDRLEFEYTGDLSLEEMLRRISELPPRSVVIYGNLFSDKTGRAFIPRDVAEMVAKASSGPVFGLYDTLLGTGIVGGSMLSFGAEGARAAEVALDILNGKIMPAEKTIVLVESRVPMFDWRQIKRWGGSSSRLPERSIFVNFDHSLWEQYRGYLIGFIAFSLTQSFLVAVLLVQRRRRRLAEEGLTEQLRFETLLADLSARFVKLSSGEIDREIQVALAQVMDFFHADRCGLLGVRPDHNFIWVAHASYAEGIEPVSQDINLAAMFPWCYRVLVEQGQHLNIARTRELPEEADQDRVSLTAMGARSFLIIPLFIKQGIRHLIVIQTVREERHWPEEYIPRLRLLGEIFVGALERKKAEQALHESEERLNLAADSANAGLWALDADTGLIWGTEKGWGLFGLSPRQEVSFERFLESVHPEDRDRVVNAVQQVLHSGEHISVEYRIIIPDGSIRWISSIGRRQFSESGKSTRLMGVSMDITELKRSQEFVLESEEFNRAVLASLRNHIAILDKEGTILSVNEAWEHFALENGASSLSGLGPGVNYLEVCRRSIRTDDSPAIWALDGIQSVLDRTRDSFSLEYPCDSPSESRWFFMKVMPFARSGGGVVVSHTNISERRTAELEARHQREELAHITRIVTVGEMATSLAHEINQPLTSILCNAQAARRFLSSTAPDLDEVREILDDIINDDQRAGEVIRRLRTLVRKEAPRNVTLNLNDIILDTMRLVRTTSELERLSITAELSTELPAVQGDSVQLQQVILNLLLNAIAAMKDSPLTSRTLTIRTALEDSATARVSVADSGIGIGKCEPDRLFEPFYTTKADGLGMGLAISRTIIKAHGGTIGAENNPTGGATFYFTLPPRPTGG
jgi:PAS domain S-box-containing protein